MKVSEAMRAGCKISIPLTGGLFRMTAQGVMQASALGAAILGAAPDTKPYTFLKHEDWHDWPGCTVMKELGVFDTVVLHPVRDVEVALSYALNDLNDNYRWTRERIIEWLEDNNL